MHSHDPDLIAAFAEGSLDDAGEARALVESCAECRDEYRAQLAALELLASAPPAAMTELERAALHRHLWKELSSVPVKPVPSPWWYRWSYVAAGLFVVVGLVAVLSGQIEMGGGDSSDDALEVLSDTGSGGAEDTSGGQANPLHGAESDGAERATTTVAAAEEALPYPFADLAEEARAKRQSGDVPIQPSVSGDVAECLARLGLEEQQVVDELELDRRYLVMMPDDGTRTGTVTFVAVDDCEVVYVDG